MISFLSLRRQLNSSRRRRRPPREKSDSIDLALASLKQTPAVWTSDDVNVAKKDSEAAQLVLIPTVEKVRGFRIGTF
jgi:hypothetical protein